LLALCEGACDWRLRRGAEIGFTAHHLTDRFIAGRRGVRGVNDLRGWYLDAAADSQQPSDSAAIDNTRGLTE